MSVEDITFQPPFDPDAEEAVIGSVLLDPEVLNELIPFLKADHFYVEAWRQAYALFLELWTARRAIDMIVLKREIEARKWTDLMPRLAAAVQSTTTPAHAAHYAKVVLEYAQLRGLRAMASKVLSRVDDREDPTAIAMEITASAAGVSEALSLGTAVTRPKGGLAEAIEQARREEKDDSPDRLPWSICPKFDARGAVIQSTDFPIVAARPGVGKTTFALQWAKVTAQRTGRPVIFVSLETPARDLWLKVGCCHAGVPEPRGQRMPEKDAERLSKASEELEASCPLHIVDSPPTGLHELLALLRRLRERLDPVAVVIDYLGLIDVPKASPYEAASKASRALRTFALKERVGVIAVHQLSRAMEKEKRPPQMSDLRDSGQLEQDATAIVFLHQESVHDDTNIRDVVAILAKSRRGGAPCAQQLRLMGHFSRFVLRTPGEKRDNPL